MKESFVLYLEHKDIFDELDNDEAGKLIKAIFEYQNTGEIVELDRSLRLAFIPIKNALDRNEAKWEAERQKRREAGRLGGLAKSSNAKHSLATPSNANQEVANLAVNVNVNDNVNVNVSENVSVSEKEITVVPSSIEIDSELFIELPLINKTTFPIYEKDLTKWKEIYPAVNIEQEFRNMLGWCNSNPRNRKTKSGISRFINNWLSRSQDRARITPVPTNNYNSQEEVSEPEPIYEKDIEIMTDAELADFINRGGF